MLEADAEAIDFNLALLLEAAGVVDATEEEVSFHLLLCRLFVGSSGVVLGR